VKPNPKCMIPLIAVIISISSSIASAQGTTGTAGTSSHQGSTFPKDYPSDRPGVFIQGVVWISVPSAMPSKTHAKHELAAYLSYGAVPAPIVADYDGPHAVVQVGPGQPTICICRMISLPGAPTIVKLHPKKKERELDGGNLPILYGSKMIQAKKNDMIPVEISQPEDTVWLVRPTQELATGEYALMLGTQNISIFPFTVSTPEIDSSDSSSKKQ